MELARVRFIDHQGKQVLLLDFSDGKAEDVSSIIAQARPLIKKAAPRSLLTLSDMTNISIRDISSQQLVSFAKDNEPFVKAAALTGISGLARSILSTTVILTRRKFPTFDTRQQALDWLVSA